MSGLLTVGSSGPSPFQDSLPDCCWKCNRACWVAVDNPDSVFSLFSHLTRCLSPRHTLASQPHSLCSSFEATNLTLYYLPITFTFHTLFWFLVYFFNWHLEYCLTHSRQYFKFFNVSTHLIWNPRDTISFYFTEEKIEAQSDEHTCSSSHRCLVLELRFGPRLSCVGSSLSF